MLGLSICFIKVYWRGPIFAWFIPTSHGANLLFRTMASKVAKDALRRISKEIPDLSGAQLGFIEACLDDCFEVGKAWDDIPVLIDEAQTPEDSRRQPSQADLAKLGQAKAKQPKAVGSKS